MTRSIRLLGAVLGTIIAFQLASVGGPAGSIFDDTPNERFLFVAWVIAWLVVGFLILPYLTVEPASWLLRKVEEMSTGEFVTAVAGLLVGLLMGLLLGLPLSNLPDPYGRFLPLGVSAALGFGMLGLTVAKRHDLSEALAALGLVPHRSRSVPEGPIAPSIVVDTSVLIDGRITDVAASGFLFGTLLVPRSVLTELQAIADSPDALRRSRGRRGLEILSTLQREARVPVEVIEDLPTDDMPVDRKLIAVARARDAALLTNDYNLNRVAEVEGLRVLNVNHLANAVKPAFLPGEELRVKVVQEGKEPGQGVAFLDDGTMIVVEGGLRFLDRETPVTVTRVLQTVAGRMVFAQPPRRG
jgi:uncharacterized protein YacL